MPSSPLPNGSAWLTIAAFAAMELFWKSRQHGLLCGLGPLRIVSAFLLAALLNTDIRGRRFYRVPTICHPSSQAGLVLLLAHPAPIPAWA